MSPPCPSPACKRHMHLRDLRLGGARQDNIGETEAPPPPLPPSLLPLWRHTAAPSPAMVVCPGTGDTRGVAKGVKGDTLQGRRAGRTPCHTLPLLVLHLWDADSEGESGRVSMSNSIDYTVGRPMQTTPPASPKHHYKKAGQIPSDSPSWLEAWNCYLCVRVAHQPSIALELNQTMFFSKHQPHLV